MPWLWLVGGLFATGALLYGYTLATAPGASRKDTIGEAIAAGPAARRQAAEGVAAAAPARRAEDIGVDAKGGAAMTTTTATTTASQPTSVAAAASSPATLIEADEPRGRSLERSLARADGPPDQDQSATAVAAGHKQATPTPSARPLASRAPGSTSGDRSPSSSVANAKASTRPARVATAAASGRRPVGATPHGAKRDDAPREALTDVDVAVVSALIGRTPAPQTAQRTEPQTIAGLVQQCLEAREAAACQRRICAGYWGKARACPAR